MIGLALVARRPEYRRSAALPLAQRNTRTHGDVRPHQAGRGRTHRAALRRWFGPISSFLRSSRFAKPRQGCYRKSENDNAEADDDVASQGRPASVRAVNQPWRQH